MVYRAALTVQNRLSSCSATPSPPQNLPDLNLLLPSREESWRVDTFKFHILPGVINSLSGRAWIQSSVEQSGVVLTVQGCWSVTHTLYYTITVWEILVRPPWLGAMDVARCVVAECEQQNNVLLLFQLDEFHVFPPHLTITRSPTPTLSCSS